MAEALAIYESKRGKAILIVYVRRHVIVPCDSTSGESRIAGTQQRSAIRPCNVIE
jgi:hypothetical protein